MQKNHIIFRVATTFLQLSPQKWTRLANKTSYITLLCFRHQNEEFSTNLLFDIGKILVKMMGKIAVKLYFF